MKYNLSTLLLLTALAAVSIAWVIDRASKPEVLYLHLFSCRYDFLSNDTNSDPSGWQCLSTIAFTPGESIYYHAPMFYSPTITATGRIQTLDDSTVLPALKISAYDAGLACEWSHDSPERIGEPVRCPDDAAGMDEFIFMVTHSEDPPDMADYGGAPL